MADVLIYIVRIDRRSNCFSATARRVDEESTVQFGQPQLLLEFLLGEPVSLPGAPRRAEQDAGRPD